MRGFSLIQTVAGLLILGLIVMFVVQIVPTLTKQKEQQEGQQSLDVEVARLLQRIVSVGRLSKNCSKQVVVSPASVAIQCNVDFAGGVNKTVRFIKNDGEPSIYYEEQSGGGPWTRKETFKGSSEFAISSFIVCNSADMAAATCPLTPAKINARYTALTAQGAALAPPVLLSDRFFRFAIERTRLKTNEKNMMQGAFFIRATTATGEPEYLWGVQG